MNGFSRQLRLILASALVFGLAACGGGVVTNVSIGGTISGFKTGTLTLTNGLSVVTMNAGATSFLFPTRVAVGLTYNVGVITQPAGLTCLVTNGLGVALTTDITNVVVTCATNNKLGGTITGLNASGLTLANGSSTLEVAGNSTTFEFATKVMTGATYGVTVLKQPTNQLCTVTDGAKEMGATDVNSIKVTCVNT